MRTFAQKQKPTLRVKPATSVTPERNFFRQNYEIGSVLHSERTIGNQTVKRLPEANDEKREDSLPISASPDFGHNFGQVALFPVADGFLTDEDGNNPAVESISQEYPGSALPAPPDLGQGPSPASTPAFMITSRTAASAPDGTPDTRTTIGVCEDVEFDVGGDVVDWSVNKGAPRVKASNSKFLWAAPETSGTATITATRPATGETCSLDMKVIAPNKIGYKKKSDEPIPQGNIGAVMKLEATVLPLNVNFGWIATKEDPGPATNVTGYFGWANRRHGISFDHAPNPNFKRVGWDNRFCCDIAGIRGPFPRPWRYGSFQWNIPNRYRCIWSTGAGHVYYTSTQTHLIKRTGRIKVFKEGATTL